MSHIIEIDGIRVSIGTHQGKKLVIGADHCGFEHKEYIKKKLKESGCAVNDVGTHTRDRCDYPEISETLGNRISSDPLNTAGIALCGSGIGILIPAGKKQGVYPARCMTIDEARLARKHDNTNLLGIGADRISIEDAWNIVHTWLESPFYSNKKEEERYLQRFVQVVKLEQQHIRL